MSETKQSNEPEGPRSFAVMLQSIDEGSLHTELSDSLQKMNGELHDLAVSAGGKAKGTLTLTLNVAVEANGIVSLDSDVKTKVPKPKRARAVFWLTKGNNLSPENPRQQRLPLREVPPTEKPRDLPSAGHTTRSV